MLHNVVPEIIAHQVGVPTVAVQQPLHPVGSGVARLLRQLPAVLALDRTDQSPQIVQHPPARLRTPEPSGNADVNLFNSFGPPGYFRQFLLTCCHHHTSSLDNGLFYLVIVRL